MVSAIVDNQPPRSLYAAAMGVIAILAAGCAFVASAAVDDHTRAPVITAVLVGALSLTGLLPSLTHTTERFGLAVLGASILRMIALLAGAVVLTELAGQPNRPVWFGMLAGAVTALVAESAIAVAVLSAAERRKHGAASLAQESNPTC
ncbi:MAG: hypothetical protein IPJ41_08735 [Phycisphaerales bacterium]|nr:hypothetical protein [Phycisphaerales bacterium]